MKNIILFPGSFDPIHLGHFQMAKNASVYLNADVIFIPAVVSVWKNDSAPFKHKLKMIELMIKGEERMSVSNYEGTTNKEINYSINTIRYFKEIYKDDNLFLLIGEDQVNEFHRWKNAEEISKLAKIIFFQRPDIEIVSKNVKQFNMKELTGTYVDYSSSDIRELVSLDTKDEIINYISENSLYFIEKISEFIDQKRLSHSIEVAKLARLIAEKNKIDKSSAYIAGLLHDIGKSAKNIDVEVVMKENYPEFLDMPPFSYHQFIGEYIAKTFFGIKDEEVLKAIKYHATGNDDMNPLGKIIYSADKIEPTRGFDSSDLIESCLKNYEEGFIKVLKANKEYLTITKKDIENRLTKSCFNKYL